MKRRMAFLLMAGLMAGTMAVPAAAEESITCDILVWSPAEDQSEQYGSWLQTQCEAFAAEHPDWTITFS